VIDREEAGPVGWLLEQLDLEWNSAAPGARIASNDLLRLVFIHVLRAYMARQTSQHPGWLAGLADARLAPALRAIHADPSRRWTVEALSYLAGQSRSGFAERFRATVGASPIDYLANWRMRLAAARLRRGNEPLPRIAQSLGYASDSAFAASFRRVLGQSPARYRSFYRDKMRSEVANSSLLPCLLARRIRREIKRQSKSPLSVTASGPPPAASYRRESSRTVGCAVGYAISLLHIDPAPFPVPS